MHSPLHAERWQKKKKESAFALFLYGENYRVGESHTCIINVDEQKRLLWASFGKRIP